MRWTRIKRAWDRTDVTGLKGHPVSAAKAICYGPAFVQIVQFRQVPNMPDCSLI